MGFVLEDADMAAKDWEGRVNPCFFLGTGHVRGLGVSAVGGSPLGFFDWAGACGRIQMGLDEMR